jgi:imidazole glycerol-phosphate synthase subunit HisH
LIAIVDYNTGNLASIRNMIRKIGYEAEITSDVDEIDNAEKLILPGVGHFDFGMRNLNSLGLTEVLNKKVLVDKVPILGICLGVQLFMKGSDEGSEPGLGWIDGYTRSFDKVKLGKTLKIPHMGWSEVELQRDSKLFNGFTEEPRFYFVHSYHLTCHSKQDELGHATHGYPFVAAIEHANIFGVQFHPEKSHRFGMHLLGNFLKLPK